MFVVIQLIQFIFVLVSAEADPSLWKTVENCRPSFDIKYSRYLVEICHKVDTSSSYEKIVVKKSTLQSHLNDGDLLPGKVFLYHCSCSCECKKVQEYFETNEDESTNTNSNLRYTDKHVVKGQYGKLLDDIDENEDEEEENCVTCAKHKILLCHKRIDWNGEGPKYVPVCTSPSKLEKYLNKGAIYPDTHHHGVSYDCSCDLVETNVTDDDTSDDDDGGCHDYGCQTQDAEVGCDDDEQQCLTCKNADKIVLCKGHKTKHGNNKPHYHVPKCVSTSKVDKYLNKGAFYPNTTHDGNLYDCNCKVVGHQSDPHGSCDDHPYDDCESSGDGSLLLKQNTTCNLRKLEVNLYRITVVVTVASEESTAVVIGLDNYNENIRKRGSCDNRQSNTLLPWDDSLWSPSTLVNEPLWRIKSVLPQQNGAFNLITYEADFTLNDLLNCVGPIGETNLITVSDKNTVYEGVWHISKNIPARLNDESSGEMVQFEKDCSFQIHQSGSGVDSICYITDKMKLFVRWMKSICTSDGKLGFIIETCLSSASSANNQNALSLLYDPTISITPNVPNGTFSIAAMGQDGECDYVKTSIHNKLACCQLWMIEGLTNDALPPFVEPVVINWRKGKQGDNLYDPVYYNNTDTSKVVINACVLDSCDSFNTIIVNDTITGRVRLYKDDQYLNPYVFQSSRPFADCARVYAQLHLNVPKTQCLQFIGLFRSLTLTYVHNGNETLEEIIIYDIDNGTTINGSIYDVRIDTDPLAPCYPRISWKLRSAHYKHVKVIATFSWNVTHVPTGISASSNDNSGEGFAIPSPMVKYTNRFAYNHHFLNDDTNSLMEIERTKKILSSVDKIKYAKYKFPNQMDHSAVEVECRSDDDWDGRRCHGENHLDDVYYWFPGASHHDDTWIWALSIALIFAVCLIIPILWCLHGHCNHYCSKYAKVQPTCNTNQPCVKHGNPKCYDYNCRATTPSYGFDASRCNDNNRQSFPFNIGYRPRNM